MNHDDRPRFPADYRYCYLKFDERTVMLDDDEPSRYMAEWTGKVEWSDPDGDEIRDIGAFSVILIDSDSAAEDGVARHDVYDTEQTTFSIFEDLIDFDTGTISQKVVDIAAGPGEYLFSENVLYLDRLVIYPEHRGHGVGLLVLRALMDQFRASTGLVVMTAFPLQFEGKDGPTHERLSGRPRSEWNLAQFKGKRCSAATARLRRHYAKLGFQLVPKTQFMVRSAYEALPGTESFFPSR